jgi:hypothetical protein
MIPVLSVGIFCNWLRSVVIDTPCFRQRHVHEKHERHEKEAKGIPSYLWRSKAAVKDFPFVLLVYFVDKVYFCFCVYVNDFWLGI